MLSAAALAATITLPQLAHAAPPVPTPLPPGSTIAVLPLRGDVTGYSLDPLLQAYRDIGYETLPPAEVAARLDTQEGKACLTASPRCNFHDALATLQTQALVIVALWQRNGKPYEVAVRVIRPETEGRATLTIDGRPVATAMKSAAASALSRAEQSSLVAVQVQTDPPGALVTVDRRQEGTAPAEFSLSPGKHLFIVSHPGFVTESAFLDVSSENNRTVVHRVNLKRDTGSADASPPPDSATPTEDRGITPPTTQKASPWNYVVGGGLAAGAVPLLVYGIRGAVQAGGCEGQTARGVCQQTAKIGVPEGVSLGIGAAAALGSAYFLVLQPIRVRVSPYGLGLNVQGRF